MAAYQQVRPSMNIRKRTWSKLNYRDPKEILINLREIDRKYPLKDMPYKVSTLRTKSLKSHGESRQRAIFCYGMSQAFGITFGYAESAEDDYDFIAYTPEHKAFIPIQMKELVPEKLNSDTGLQAEIDTLKKYVDSNDLLIAMYINR